MIQAYMQDVLTPQLRQLRLSPEQIEIVTEDVRARIEATIWHLNTDIGAPLLEIVRELAAWYAPHAPLRIKQIVATAIRNSVLEDVGAQHPVNEALRGCSYAHKHLDDLMPTMTGDAIRHFTRIPSVGRPSADPFGHLPEQFPRAWRAFSTLASMRGTKSRVRMPTNAPPVSRLLVEEEPRGDPHALMVVVESGFNPAIGPDLAYTLNAMLDGNIGVFFSDSFKEISRLPDKVLHVIEYVLAAEGSFVTYNYLITPEEVARRVDLVRPAHTVNDVRMKAKQVSGGASKLHAQVLGGIRNQLLS
jgi:hypothetical protein